MKISELFEKQHKTFSFEFFPPKTFKSAVGFGRSIERLAELEPDFISVTYGAGGSTQEKTFDLIDYIQNKMGLTSMCHYTCVGATKEKIAADLDHLYEHNIENLMLLRGDAPEGQESFKDQEFQYSTDLIEFAGKQDRFCIGAAGYPEGHQEAKDLDFDLERLKEKFQKGADFVCTQMFLDNDYFYHYMKKVREKGIENRIIPGLIPITNYKNIKKFAEMCGSAIPEHVQERFEPIKHDSDKVYQRGIDLAIEQAEDLLKAGAPGIHFYTLNKYQPIKDIYDSLPKDLLDVHKRSDNIEEVFA
jgi:methylenetetrahydrofolate reductase (NADPH)